MPPKGNAQTPPSLSEWKRLTEEERNKIVSSWNPYTDDGAPLLHEIEQEFRREYGHLKGLVIGGIGNCHGGLVMGVTHKLIFDRRKLPHHYPGLPVYCTVSDIPEGFRVFGSYIRAPENYEHLVDHHMEEVREQLGDPTMTREEMLHALCGMEFAEWVEIRRGWGRGHTSKQGSALSHLIPGASGLSPFREGKQNSRLGKRCHRAVILY